MARIVIAGCGDVGTRLGLTLSAAGHQVWGLRRRPEQLPTPIQPLAADLSRPETLGTLPDKLDALYYTAAAGGYSEANYRAAYVGGVANVFKALSDAGQRLHRAVFVSSTSVYGQRDGSWIDEQSPANAEGFAADSLRAGEALFHASELCATASVVRFGGIYGPGRTRLIDALRAGNARCTPGVFSNRIHRDDCGDFLAHLLDLEQPQPLYLGVDNEPTTLCDVLEWLAVKLGTEGPALTAAVSNPRSRRQSSNKRCRNDRLRASGYRLSYPSFREGYTALLR